ncbi:MAG: cob(I)yrinic acid a,c-diamide adenosyltransferase [Bacteroidota bacterium]
MKIYTKTGDEGETSLFGGRRVPKFSLRIETYGTADELNSQIGVIRSLKPKPEIDTLLEKLQSDLFILGTDLATPVQEREAARVRRIESGHIAFLEDTIDRIEEHLPVLHSFVLPGGSAVAAQIHAARTICRRCERLAVRLEKEEQIGKLPLIFLNRLSDFLFVLARYANLLDGVSETIWKP